MPKGRGDSLGAAVHDLMRVTSGNRTWKQQLDYVLAKTTGASLESVARQIGVPPRRVRIWRAREATPSKASQANIARVFERFWEINNRNYAGRTLGDRMLRVSGRVYVSGKERKSIIVEKGRHARDWATLRTSTDEEISQDNGRLFKDALDIGIPYVEFRRGGYTIETLQ